MPGTSRNAVAVAEYLLAHQKPGTQPISHLKLQKLCYWAQGVHLALYGEPLFYNPIRAWAHGPVVPEIYHKYKSHVWASIAIPDVDDREFTVRERHVLDLVIKVWGVQQADVLRNMTHDEAPWIEAREGNEAITQSMLREFFKPRVDAWLAPDAPEPHDKLALRREYHQNKGLQEKVAVGLRDFAEGRYSKAS